MSLTINHQTNDISATSGSVNVSSDLTVDTSTLYVDSTNNRVGVGTTSPSYGRLHIHDDNSDISMDANGSGQLHIDGNGYGFGIALNSSGANLYTNSASRDLIFGTNETERMRINGSGNLLVGTTTHYGSSYRMSLAPATGTGGILFKNYSGTNTGAPYAFLNTSGTLVGYISTSSTATAYNTSSDYRLKENVTNVTDGITRVKQLEPKRFNFIADPDTTVDGFLAHEAQTVVPEAVTGTHNEVDDDGNAVMQGIDQAKLVPLLTAALKESIAKIEALEARVTALEGN
jgi:hypothetical protein